MSLRFIAQFMGMSVFAVQCPFHKNASSSVANINEWKWKISILLRSDKDKLIVPRDKRDRQDFEQISNLAKRMGLYCEIYGKMVVASKVLLPNYTGQISKGGIT